MDQATSVGQVVGGNLQYARLAAGWTQVEAIRHLRVEGLDWSRTQLASLESGRREDVTVSELFLLAAALDVPVRQLLKASNSVRLGRLASSDGGWLAAILSTDRPGALDGLVIDLTGSPELAEDAVNIALMGRLVPSEAEAHAAKRLHIEPTDVYRIASRLWGHGLDEERDARLTQKAPASARTAYRGHVTRALLAEIREEVTE